MDQYTVVRYDCDRDEPTINDLATAANTQQAADPHPFDSRVLPWIHGCAKSHKSVIHVRHYVAKMGNGKIVGWLLAETRRRFGRIYVYLSEISVIREVYPQYRGIGRALHAALIADAREDGAFFIYLYPLTDEAEATYTKWGYTNPYEDVKQQFLELRKPTDKNNAVPKELIAKLKPSVPATLFVEAHRRAMDLGDSPLAKKVDIVSRKRKTDKAFVEKLRSTLETIAIFTDPGESGEETMSEAEQLAALHEIFDAEGGRRRSRKNKRRSHRTRRR